MTEKTIQGKKCPKCFSFVKDGLPVCPVCGQELGKKDQKTLVENGRKVIPTKQLGGIESRANIILCSKCGTENSDDFKFCKICKHPLKEDNTDASLHTLKPSSICLAIEWINAPEKSKTESSLSLTQFTPYFSGYTRWKDYGFFVNKMQEGYEILVKKLPVPSSSTMFKQNEEIFILESGCEFYLGAVKFQLLGDFREDKDHKTVVKSNKTILKGPGERRRQHFFEGLPRLKIDRITSKREFVEINEKFRLGRSQIAELFGANEDELRKNGISKEHITLMPFMGGLWILEPLPAKPVFVEINESPVILQPGKTIRWVSDDQVEEFQLVIHSAGG